MLTLQGVATSVLRMHCRSGCRLSIAAVAWGFFLSLVALAARAESNAPIVQADARVASKARIPRDGLLDGFDPLSHSLRNGVHVAALAGGRRAELTLDPGLQAHVKEVLVRYDVPYGAVVALEPESGRVLAYVSHSTVDPAVGDLVRDASPPAASVFKIVTAAALLDSGVRPRASTCYNGGVHSIELADLRDDPRKDRQCATLAEALGQSINSVFAKQALRRLDTGVLARYASAFAFGQGLPFDVPLSRSACDIPRQPLEFARTAAGFWHMHLSPMHGVLIAATVASGGVMPRPSMVERILGPRGKVLHSFRPRVFRRVLKAATARALGRMMRLTVASGTAHSAFHDAQGVAFLPGVDVAAKTGSLTATGPYRAYSWWVGFAPADNPRIALAALVVNSPKWRIKGSHVAREALRQYLH